MRGFCILEQLAAVFGTEDGPLATVACCALPLSLVQFLASDGQIGRFHARDFGTIFVISPKSRMGGHLAQPKGVILLRHLDTGSVC